MGEGTEELVKEKVSAQEESARAKIREIDAPGTLIHITTVDRLSTILSEGLVSQNFALKTGKSARMRWPHYDDADPNKVFVGKLLDSGDLYRSALHISHPQETDQIATVILKPELTERKLIIPTNAPITFLVKNRISPSFFEGIAIGGSDEAISKGNYHDYVPQVNKEDITDLGNPEIINALRRRCLQVMKEVFGEDDQRYLPLYDMKGNVLWPENSS